MHEIEAYAAHVVVEFEPGIHKMFLCIGGFVVQLSL